GYALKLSALDLQDDSLRAIFGQKARDHTPVGGADRPRLVRRADDQARIKNVREKLLERGAAIGGNVRPNVLALSINLMALAADAIKDFDAAVGIARGRANELSHFYDELLAGRVTAGAYCAPMLSDRGA